MGSPKIVPPASSTEASAFEHTVWQRMLSATIPFGHLLEARRQEPHAALLLYLGRKLLGDGVKYPLYRLAGFPERDRRGLEPFEEHIVPTFETIKGLNMVDASALEATGLSGVPEPAHAGGD